MSLAPMVGLLLLTQARGREGSFRIFMGASGPRTEVRYSRPTLKWEIWADDPTRKVSSVHLTIDGKPVEAAYDPADRAVVYTPAKSLEPGVHRVECRVTFDNGQSLDQKWETRIGPEPLAELPPPDKAQIEALAAANRLRARTGLRPLVIDDRLNMAALLHSRYLALNKASGHTQSPDLPGFFGATAASRLEVYGFVGGSWEGVDFGSHSPTEAVRSLFDAPYHRLPFLQPGNVRFGSGFEGQYLTVEFGLGDAEGTVISPSDGETDVPTQWRNYEIPNPLRAFPGAPRLVGYPIVFVRHGRRPLMGEVAAKLYGPDAEEIACYFTPVPERKAVIVIPQRPLRARSRYDVVFKERTFLGSDRTFRAGFTTG